MAKGNSLVLTRVLPAARDKVFAAWTEEALIKRWFCPAEGMTVPIAELDVREGGTYRLVVEDTEGKTYSPSGNYEKIVLNEQLVFSWKWADSELITRVTIDLRAARCTPNTYLQVRRSYFEHVCQSFAFCINRINRPF